MDARISIRAGFLKETHDLARHQTRVIWVARALFSRATFPQISRNYGPNLERCTSMMRRKKREVMINRYARFASNLETVQNSSSNFLPDFLYCARLMYVVAIARRFCAATSKSGNFRFALIYPWNVVRLTWNKESTLRCEFRRGFEVKLDFFY